MRVKTKKLIGIGLLAGVAVGYVIFNSPIVTYEWGKFQASRHRPGSIAGLSVVRLNVPYHRQEHALSCELASLKMVLNYYGVDVTESEIIEQLYFDRTPKSKWVWGDPSVGFVGNIDGRMGVSGYGVHAEPVSAVANKWKTAEAVTGLTPADVAAHLLENRPVIAWGYYGDGKKIAWQTASGKIINAVHGEHARVITGFVGDRENPDGFIILDPIYGELFWETEELMKNWRPFDYSGVIVY